MLICLLHGQAATAQQNAEISPSLVLVLKLVSSTNVRPTTGIVVSNDGLVLVSADFASADGEVIVLDGGTDIISNGRPATLVPGSVTGELAVLSVAGLKRPGIKLSSPTAHMNTTLHLEAFPPAEDIARGQPPVWLPLNVTTGEISGEFSVSPDTPLPSLTGAIVDACGYLAGINLSSGSQSLGGGKNTRIISGNELGAILGSKKISLPAAVCERPLFSVDADTTAIAPGSPSAETMQAPEQLPEDTRNPSDNTEAPGAIGSLPGVIPGTAGVSAAPARQVSADPTGPPSVWRAIPPWLALLGMIAFGVLTWKGFYLFRLGKNGPDRPNEARHTSEVQPASDEPVTAPLENSETDNDFRPRSAPVIDFEIPESGQRPEGCDAVLIVEGYLDADTFFRRFCFVNAGDINIVIGRGDADIAIEHAAISRSHARIESDGKTMTLSDLGSRNGTFLGEVPCLPGEVFYFEAEDEIFLGDVKMTVRLVRQEALWA